MALAALARLPRGDRATAIRRSAAELRGASDPFDPGDLREARDVASSKAIHGGAGPGDHRLGVRHGDRRARAAPPRARACPTRATAWSWSASRPPRRAGACCSRGARREDARALRSGAGRGGRRERVLGARGPGGARRLARAREPPPALTFVVHGEAGARRGAARGARGPAAAAGPWSRATRERVCIERSARVT